jgi:hypothetical protein
MSQEINNELVEIIKLLGHEHEPGQKSSYASDEYLHDLRERVSNLQTPATAGELVDILREDIKSSDDRYRHREPYLKIFLSYAYIVSNINTEALIYAGKTHEYDWDNKWDYALSRWFLGIVYIQNRLFQEARNELTDAQNNLEQYCNDAEKRHKENRVCNCNNVIEKIKHAIKNLPERIPQPSLSMAGADRKSPPEKTSRSEHDQQQNDVGSQHVISMGTSSENIEKITDDFDSNYVVTPSFPIYGGATAGPDGQVFFDKPDYKGAVDESALIRFGGREYQVYSVKGDDKQIAISFKNFLTSIVSRKTSNEIGGQRYGWLKVAGNSMNNANPIPIESGDYVLFIENRNPEDKKIVIASLPDSLEICLVVKRLVKTSEKQQERAILRSESLDKDPKTQAKYQDLVVCENNQVIGEVVAIAKPKG